MNKFGIKVYSSGITYIEGIHYSVNSIKNHKLTTVVEIYKFRVINWNKFGIDLVIK